MPKQNVTALIKDYASGEDGALDKLVPVIYEELKRIARHQLPSGSGGKTLQPTALVNEVFLRMKGKHPLQVQNRTHFFATASRMMRQVLLDHFKAKGRAKRGGDNVILSFDEKLFTPKNDGPDLFELNAVLEKLAKVNERQFRIVELRYFGGLSIEETAEAVGCSLATVKRDWLAAKLFLYRELSQAD